MPQSETGSKNDLYPEQITLEEDQICRKRTTLEKCLVVVSIVLLIFAIIMTILFAVYYADSNGNNIKVCTSRNCVVTASSMSVKMDFSSDPCEDFAQYACGNYYRDTLIPDDKNKVTSFSKVNDENEHLIRAFLQEDVSKDDPDYVVKIKTYYKSCMDEDTIEKIGLTPYTSSEEAKDWPTINPSWDDSTFDLHDLIVKYERRFVEPIFTYAVSLNMENSSLYQLHLFQPSLSMSLKYMKLPRNDSNVMAYQQYYIDIAMALGANETTAKADAEALVDFEMEIAKICITQEEAIDISTLNNPSTLRNMSRDYPYIDWHRSVQAAFDTINKTIPEDLPVINQHPKFFKKFGPLIKSTDKRVIQNRFGFIFARMNVESLTKEMRRIFLKFKKIHYGKKSENPRWRQCIDHTDSVFGVAIGKKFVSETFSEGSKKYMDTMIVNLKTAFGQLLHEAEWMHPTTKEAAFMKLKTMNRKIGYPDDKFEDRDITQRYENFTVFKDEYYKTNHDAFVQMNRRSLARLDKIVDKTEWRMSPSEVNAYYAGSSNEIGFPAGILQPPFFSDKYPSSVNYGAIGMIIGHEITHGYDQRGSQFDYKGNLKNWWQVEDKIEFKKKTQCVIDHYSNYTVKAINMNLNGQLTAGENTADIGGLKEAYRAYKTYAATQQEELPLPGLQLTTDQQFFLAFAQLWCAKSTKASLKSSILSGVHSTGRFRILGPLQNSNDFARAFQCPSGSPMNPVEKCEVW